MIFRLLVAGASQAGIFMLLAVGMSLIFGVARIINLAHTAFFMVTAYLIVYISQILGYGFAIGAISAVLITTLFGLATYWFILKPIKEHAFGGVAMVIVTVGMGLALRELALLITHGTKYSISYIISGSTQIIGVTITNQRLLIIAVAPIVVLLVWLIIEKTEFGIAIQAASQDAEVANLMGVNTERTNLMVMGLSVFLASLAAVLIGSLVMVQSGMWQQWLFPVMAVVVLGGFGSLKGSVIASVILGMVIASVPFFFPGLTFLGQAVALLTLVGVLVVRPGGIAGVPLEEF